MHDEQMKNEFTKSHSAPQVCGIQNWFRLPLRHFTVNYTRVTNIPVITLRLSMFLIVYLTPSVHAKIKKKIQNFSTQNSKQCSGVGQQSTKKKRTHTAVHLNEMVRHVENTLVCVCVCVCDCRCAHSRITYHSSCMYVSVWLSGPHMHMCSVYLFVSHCNAVGLCFCVLTCRRQEICGTYIVNGQCSGVPSTVQIHFVEWGPRLLDSGLETRMIWLLHTSVKWIEW